MPSRGLRDWTESHKLFEPVSSAYTYASPILAPGALSLSACHSFYTLEINDRVDGKRLRAAGVASGGSQLERAPLYFAALLNNEVLVRLLLDKGGTSSTFRD